MESRTKAGVLFDKLLDVCIGLACLIVVFQVISVSLDVVWRELFGVSSQWITPVNEWGLIYLTFLGVAWLQREKGHVGDDSVAACFPVWVRSTFRVVGIVLAVCSCLLLTVYGSIVTWQRYATNAYDYFKLDSVPIYIAYLIIPLGSLLWLIQIIREIVVERGQKNQEQENP